MTRASGEIPPEEERLLGIERLSPEEEAAQEKRQQEEAEVERLYLIGLMNQPQFRAWMMKQLVAFNTFGRIFAVSPTGFPDAPATEYQLGLKAAGWHLWSELDDKVPDLASKMRREFGR